MQDYSAASLDAATRRINEADRALSRLRANARRRGADIQFRYSLTDRASAPAQRLRQNLTRQAQPIRLPMTLLDGVTAPLRGIFNMLTSTRTLVAGLFAGVAGQQGLINPINIADDIGRTRIAFGKLFDTMKYGTQGQAMDFFGRAQEFAIATPFRMREVMRHTQQLLAFRFSPNEILGTDQGKGGILDIIGDAAAISGGGEEAMHRIIVAMGQMRAAGRVSAQDMLQLTNANIRAWEYLAEEFGVGTDKIRKLAENNLLPVERSIAGLFKGMKRDFNGLNQELADKTVVGVLSQIQDFVEVNVIARWGEGLREGLLPALRSMNTFLGNNRVLVGQWGDALQRAARDGVDFLTGRFNGLFNALGRITRSSEWQQGGTATRMRMVWRELITDPLDAWWKAEGKIKITEAAGNIGGFLGEAIGTAVRIGVTGGAGKESDAIEIGRTFGQRFMQGFKEAWNGMDWMVFLFGPTIGGKLNEITRAGEAERSKMSLERQRREERRGSGGGSIGGGQGAGGAPTGPPPVQVAAEWISAQANKVGQLFTGGALAQRASSAFGQRMSQAGLGDTIADACGIIAATALADGVGQIVDPATVMQIAQQQGLWEKGVGMTDAQNGMKRLLGHLNIDAATIGRDEAMRAVEAGGRVAISTYGGRRNGIDVPGHYYVANGMDANGRLNVGSTGEAMSAYGGSASMTLAEIEALGGGIAGFTRATGRSGVDLREYARGAAQRRNLDPTIFERQIKQESGFDPNAIGPEIKSGPAKGLRAKGIAQIIPEYHPNVDPMNPIQSLDYAAEHMRDLMDKYGNMPEALAAYGGGHGAVEAMRSGQMWDETREYLKKILGGQRGPGEAGVAEGAGGNKSVSITAPITFQVFDPSDVAQAQRFADAFLEHIAQRLGDRIDGLNANVVVAGR